MWMEAFCDPRPAAGDATVLGVGLDLVHVDRAARLLEVHGEALLYRLFHQNELEGLAGLRLSAERLATVLAAKEAFFKALGQGVVRPLDWPHVEVRVTGQVSLTPRGPALEAARERGVTNILFDVGEAADARFAVATLWRSRYG